MKEFQADDRLVAEHKKPEYFCQAHAHQEAHEQTRRCYAIPRLDGMQPGQWTRPPLGFLVARCQSHCPGCWNPATHSRNAGIDTPSEKLVAQILAARAHYQIEGITFSGGEPLHQIEGIVDTLQLLRQVAPDLRVGLFSGYTERELDRGTFATYVASDVSCRRALWRSLLGLLDFAVLGRFNREQPSSDPLVTSPNQQLHLLSSRYSCGDFEDQMVEITIGSEGLTQITGFPTLGTIA